MRLGRALLGLFIPIAFDRTVQVVYAGGRNANFPAAYLQFNKEPCCLKQVKENAVHVKITSATVLALRCWYVAFLLPKD